MGGGVRWALASWIVLAAALAWQQMELAQCKEIEALLRKQNTILKKICTKASAVADIAEQVCLSRENIQSELLGVLGANVGRPTRSAKRGVTTGHVGGQPLDER